MRKAAGEARVGRTLGKYTLVRVIGEGGMAVVYEAVHRNGNRVALKLLRPEASMGADVRARFLREGYAANKVGHAGAVRILDDDERDGLAFLVMELLEGVTLDTFARGAPSENEGRGARRAVPASLALAIGAHVLDILDAAHAAGVIHRDIKPENVFLERRGSVKLLDFGIARVVMPGEASSTATGRVLGTPAFASPEQAYGRRSEVDARTDVYAVGATLFTVLSGRFVHEAESPEEALILAATERAPELASVVEVHPAVARVIDRALCRERDARWSSARAMADALRAAHEEAFGHAVPDRLEFGLATDGAVAAQGSQGVVRPRRWGLLAAAVLAMSGVVAVGWGRAASGRSVSSVPTPSHAVPVTGAAPAPSGALVARDAVSAEAPPEPTAAAPSPKVSVRSSVPLRTASAPSVHPPAAGPTTCGVDIDEEGRKWPRRCP